MLTDSDSPHATTMPAFTYLESQLKCLVVKGLLIKNILFLLLKNLSRRNKSPKVYTHPPSK